MSLDHPQETERFPEGPDCFSREQAVALFELLTRIQRATEKIRVFRHEGRNLLLSSPLRIEEANSRLSFQAPQGAAQAGYLEVTDEARNWRVEFTGAGKKIVFDSSRLLPKRQVLELLNHIAVQEHKGLSAEIADFISKVSDEKNESSGNQWGDYPKRTEPRTLRSRIADTTEAVTQIWHKAVGRKDPKDQELAELRRQNKELHDQVVRGRKTLLTGAAGVATTLGGAGILTVAGVSLGVGAFVYSNREKIPDYEDVVADGGMPRRIDVLKAPPGISDAGLVFYASAPVDSELAVDTLISNYEISRSFFNGQLLGLEVEENVKYKDRKVPRAYHFTIPSPLHGEVLNGEEQKVDHMKTVSVADTLNFLMDTPALSDQEIIEWLAWWYERTFRRIERTALELDSAAFKIERYENGMIREVFYGNSEGQHITVNQLRLLEEIPHSSAQARRDYEPKAMPLTGPSGRLLVWTGVGQDIVIPEHLLRPAEKFEFKVELETGSLQVSGKDVVDNIRDYLNVRDRGERIAYHLYGGQLVNALGHNHFMNPNDRVVKQIVDDVTDPEMSLCVKANALREFWQSNTEYIDEHGVEVNRPTLFTLMRGGGDCNNLTVGAGTLYAAAGLDVATIFADTDPEKIKDEPVVVYSAHTLNALNLDQLGQDCKVGPDVWHIPNKSGKEIPWILSEPQGENEFGEFGLGWKLTVRNIQVFDPKTRNHTAN